VVAYFTYLALAAVGYIQEDAVTEIPVQSSYRKSLRGVGNNSERISLWRTRVQLYGVEVHSQRAAGRNEVTRGCRHVEGYG